MSMEYTKPVCRGSWALGTACGGCERCAQTRPQDKPAKTAEEFSKQGADLVDALTTAMRDVLRSHIDPVALFLQELEDSDIPASFKAAIYKDMERGMDNFGKTIEAELERM